MFMKNVIFCVNKVTFFVNNFTFFMNNFTFFTNELLFFPIKTLLSRVGIWFFNASLKEPFDIGRLSRQMEL
jgi:hypothetical protein